MSTHRPNILFIVMDATRPDHLSCYGYHRQTTPNLDQLAAEGVLYEQAISPAIWTLPAVASLFTGLHVSQHGTHAQHQYLDTHFLTLAELLSSCGYRTAAITALMWVSQTFGFHRGFDTFLPASRLSTRSFAKLALQMKQKLAFVLDQETIVQKVFRHLIGRKRATLTQDTNRKLKAWLDTEYEDGVPFFMYLHYGDPHLPYQFHEPYSVRYLGERIDRAKKVNQDASRYHAGMLKMSEEDFELLKALYDGEIAYLDSMLNQVFELLWEQGILDDTLIIITADHGENIGDHGLMDHQYCLYDTLVHVPLIIRYPRLFPAGHRESDQVHTHEIFTTIMDILGVEKEKVVNDVRGRSLVPAKIAAQPLPFAISEELAPNLSPLRRKCPDFDPSAFDRGLRAVRCDGYKYIWASDGRHELYNLLQDPQELDNLIQAQPQKAKELQGILDDWLVSNEQAKFEELIPELDEAMKNRLKQLGYL